MTPARRARIRRIYRRALTVARSLPLPDASGRVDRADGPRRSRVRSAALHLTREAVRHPSDRVLLRDIGAVAKVSPSGVHRAWSRWWELRDGCAALDTAMAAAIDKLCPEAATK